MRLLDEHGLDAFSMRGLAVSLKVTSPTLYWHVPSRAVLLDQVADRIVLEGRMEPPGAGEPWQDWLLRRAHGYRDALLAHRDGARIVAEAAQLPQSTLELEHELDTLVSLGFRPLTALQLITTTSHYTLGHVLQRQRLTGQRPTDVVVAREATPVFDTAVADLGGADGAFTAGLTIIAAGAEQLIGIQQDAAPAS